MFEKLLDIAKTEIASVDEKVIGLPEPQVTVLYSNSNNFYVAVNDVDGLICEELKSKKDTKIDKMLTMWKSGCIDIASLKFRKSLVKLNRENKDTIILLKGNDGNLLKKLEVSLPTCSCIEDML